MLDDIAAALRAFHDAIEADAHDTVYRRCCDCGQWHGLADDILRAVVICPICEALPREERSGVYEIVNCSEVV